MDIDTVLLSVQERDKWRRRLDVLSATLGQVRERRGRMAERLRRLRRELKRLGEFSEALVDVGRSYGSRPTVNASREPHIAAR